MKKTLSFLSIALIISLAAFKGKKDDTYTIEAEKSTVEWLGKKVTGQHTGTIKLASGALIVDKNTIKGGKFIIDMTTIAATDGSGERLNGHLKADDFFGVAKFPTSTFAITKVTPGTGDQVSIDGDLTIKGITKPISFPASVKKEGSYIVALAKIKVDRTKYDIKFRSKNFFENLGNNMIDDDFELTVKLQAKK